MSKRCKRFSMAEHFGMQSTPVRNVVGSISRKLTFTEIEFQKAQHIRDHDRYLEPCVATRAKSDNGRPELGSALASRQMPRLDPCRHMPVPYIAHYWGKARPLEGIARHDWHPIAYHGLDVAAAGEAYLRLRPEVLARLAHRAGLPGPVTRNWLLFGLAIHDLGKYADCFQAKWRRLGTPPDWTEHDDPGHGSVGRALWDQQCDLGWDPDDASFLHLFQENFSHRDAFTHWVAAIFGHHGRPVGGPSGPLRQLVTGTAVANAHRYVAACATLFPLDVLDGPEQLQDASFKETSWLVAGTAMVADWIGSNQAWFPYEAPDHTLADYWPLAQQRAGRAILETGLSRPPVAPGFTLSDALASAAGKADPVPSDLQDWALADFKPTGQSLVIVEDLTGAGKTEAALIAAHRLMKAGLAGGLYWALPTMATANGLYARLAKSYDRLFDDPNASLVLAHGKREFNPAFKRSVLPAGRQEKPLGTAPDDESASAQCAAWIADDRRKAFLADVGVGTIDQALLAVLPAKHQALRLAALAQRVLVIDEIHSYDPYVSKLVASLLEFHAALGGSAVLLSATMTQKLRRDLVAAFAKGARWSTEAPKSHAFPLVTVVTNAKQTQEIARQSNRGTRRDLAVQRLASEAEVVDFLLKAYRRGEASVWIRNTVHDAITAADALRQRLGARDAAAVDLFHARFALGDRLAIETRTLDDFGKDSVAERRNRILVATQVVEQSLDLDFDTMVSDLAPIDLLIQRAGRLHRHGKEARGNRPDPVLHVLAPEPRDDATAKWFANLFAKAQYVYQDHGQLWLTMRYLVEHDGLKLESDSPRDPIEAVFNGSPPVGLLSVSGKAAGEAAAQRGFATMNALKLHEGYAQSTGSWKSDEITPTRLGAKQRTLRLARWDGKKLAPWCQDKDGDEAASWRLSEVQALAARVAKADTGNTAIAAEVVKVMATWPDRFDPPLLVPLQQAGDVWRCEVTAEARRGETVGHGARLVYCSSKGLRFE